MRSSSGVWSVLPVAASHFILLQPLLELGPHCWQQVRLLVGVGLQQDCPLSPIQFIIFMDRISRCCGGGRHKFVSAYFFRLCVSHQFGSSGGFLQLALQQFTAKCDVARMRISTSKSKAMVHSWKRSSAFFQTGIVQT